MNTEAKKTRKLQGVVVSDKMNKTRVVEITRVKSHPKYLKKITITKRYKAHDPENKYKVGDAVIISEIRPMSSGKRWIITEKIEKKA